MATFSLRPLCPAGWPSSVKGVVLVAPLGKPVIGSRSMLILPGTGRGERGHHGWIAQAAGHEPHMLIRSRELVEARNACERACVGTRERGRRGGGFLPRRPRAEDAAPRLPIARIDLVPDVRLTQTRSSVGAGRTTASKLSIVSASPYRRSPPLALACLLLEGRRSQPRESHPRCTTAGAHPPAPE